LRANLDWLEQLTRRPVSALRVEGKVAASRAWVQLKADVTGRCIETVRLEEATALGAALLAGIGCGMYPGHAAAGAAVEHELETRAPTPALAATYTDVFENGCRRLPGLVGDVAVVLSRATARASGPAGA
jgi:sugar (pentulose or hexulose) kinase